MKISKAVITSAGRDQRALPLQTLVDRDGKTKTALRIIIDEALSTGVDEICIVINPGDQKAYLDAAGDAAARITIAEQNSPRGYGHALFCARPFVGTDPFLHLVSDHLYISREAKRCAQQLVELAEAQNCTVSAVQSTRESVLTYYGAIGGRRAPGVNRVYEVDTVLEKPTPTEAEQTLVVPGLRAGHYLCFFGMHVLTPAVLDLIEEAIGSADERIQLSPALARLAGKERYLALEVDGLRHNIGLQYGLLTAQLALGLDGKDREEILALLVDLLASRSRQT